MTIIRIMRKRYGDMAEIVKIAVQSSVWWDDGGLEDITKDIDTIFKGKIHPPTGVCHVRVGVDHLVDSVSPQL